MDGHDHAPPSTVTPFGVPTVGWRSAALLCHTALSEWILKGNYKLAFLRCALGIFRASHGLLPHRALPNLLAAVLSVPVVVLFPFGSSAAASGPAGIEVMVRGECGCEARLASSNEHPLDP